MKINRPSHSAGASDVRKEIQARSSELAQALQHGRAGHTLQFFADNAVLLLPMRAAMVGKAALEDYFRKGEAAGRRSGISFTKRSVKGCGCGYAYETGQYSVNNNAGTKTYGHYVTVWRKGSSGWLIENQCFNVERLISDDSPTGGAPNNSPTDTSHPTDPPPPSIAVHKQKQQDVQPNNVSQSRPITQQSAFNHAPAVLRSASSDNNHRPISATSSAPRPVFYSSAETPERDREPTTENRLPIQRMTSY